MFGGRFWFTLLTPSVVIATSVFYLLYFSPKQSEQNQKFAELSHHYRDEVLTLKRAHIDNLKGIKDRLIVLEVSMKKSEMEEPKTVAPSPLAESAVSLESMSDEEYQAMVLEHVKASDRQLIEQHFKRENAFKASLRPAEKADV